MKKYKKPLTENQQIISLLQSINNKLRFNMPYNISGTLNLYKEITVPVSSSSDIINHNVINIRYGRLTKYCFGYTSGTLTAITFRFYINNKLYPNPENSDYMNDIVAPYGTSPFMEEMYHELKSGDNLKITCINTDPAIQAVVWARIKGWYFT